MDIDLFSLQGVTVVKDAPVIGLFSVQGVVVSKDAPTVKIGRANLRISQARPPVATFSRARLLVSQTAAGFVNMPTGITGLDQYKQLATNKMVINPVWSQYGIGDPVVDVANGGRDRTVVTLTALPPSPYRGTYDTLYVRRDISVLGILPLLPANFPTVRAVITEIQRRGYLIVDADIDLVASKATASSVTLVASDKSYFFTPGGKAVFGTEPTIPSLTDDIPNGNLTGFTAA